MRSKGSHYEEQAKKYLKKKGLKFLAQNYHCPMGEIDLIMRDGQTIAFVEVRFRKNPRFGSALESITRTKQNRIIKAAQSYIGKHGTNDNNYRFDVIAISNDNSTPSLDHIEWIKSAFTINEQIYG